MEAYKIYGISIDINRSIEFSSILRSDLESILRSDLLNCSNSSGKFYAYSLIEIWIEVDIVTLSNGMSIFNEWHILFPAS